MMKKKISFLLIFALILSATLSLFTVGASAANHANGKTFASDAEALAGETKYPVRIGEAGENGLYYTSLYQAGLDVMDGDTVYLIDSYASAAGSAQLMQLGAKKITIDGQNHTVTGNRDGAFFQTEGSAGGTVLIKNLTIENKGAGAIAQFSGVKAGDTNTVTLENVKIRHTEPSKRLQYGTVVIRTNVILNAGTEITNECTVFNGDNDASGLYLDKDYANLTINDGVTVKVPGTALMLSLGPTVTMNGGDLTCTKSDNNVRGVVYIGTGNLTVNGGSITSENKKTGILVAGANANLTVNGGKFSTAGGNGIVHVESGNATVNGGSFAPLTDDVKFNVAMIFVGSGTKAGGMLTVNGGSFCYPKASEKNPVFKAHESLDKAHRVILRGGDFVGTPYIFYGGSQDGSADAGKTIKIENPTMWEGASIRTAQDSSGLRFRSTISKAAVSAADKVKTPDTEVVFGTLIAPYENVVKAGGIFTREAMTAAGQAFEDVVAKDGLVKNADGSVKLSAALVNLKAENVNRKFVAVAYLSYKIEYMTEEGIATKTVTVYASCNEEDNVRSVSEVAYEALADVSTEAEEFYQTEVTEWYVFENEAWVKKTGTAYSCYSQAQLDVIKTYVAA